MNFTPFSFFIAILVAGCAAQALSKTGPMQILPPSPVALPSSPQAAAIPVALMQAYVQRPDTIAGRNAQLAMQMSRTFGCATPDYESIRILSFSSENNVQFDATGTLISGIVHERISAAGCGVVHILNFVYFGSDHGSKVIAYLPGTTKADLTLAHDTFFSAVASARARAAPCRMVALTNTSFEGFDGPPNPSAKWQTDQGRPWRELWTFNGCGTEIALPIRFTPDAGGTAFSILTFGRQ